MEGEFSDLVFTTGIGSSCSRYIVDKEVKKVIKRICEKETVLDNKMDKEIKKFGVAKTQNDPYSEINVEKIRITAKNHCKELYSINKRV